MITFQDCLAQNKTKIILHNFVSYWHSKDVTESKSDTDKDIPLRIMVYQ